MRLLRSILKATTVPQRVPRVLFGLVLVLHVVLVGWSAAIHSPVFDEIAHLPAGISCWKYGRFDLYRVNPPLVRCVAAIPSIIAGASEDWSRWKSGVGLRAEWNVGRDFLEANGPNIAWHFRMARWMCLPFSLLGATICWIWARELYGDWSGLFAATLWCLSPTVLAWSATITPDVAAASCGCLAAYRFAKWTQDPSYTNVVWAGLALGLAELCKMTLVILIPLWFVIGIVFRIRHGMSRPTIPPTQHANEPSIVVTLPQQPGLVQLTCIIALGLWCLNAGYCFDGTGTRLDDYEFVSQLFSGSQERLISGNRFRGSSLGRLAVPLPRDYLLGMDQQKLDFETPQRQYLNGRWSASGSGLFYPEALLLKEPIGTCFVVLFTSLSFGAGILLKALRRWTGSRNANGIKHTTQAQIPSNSRNEFILAIHFVAILVFLMANPEVSYLRYAIPCLPFAYIWASRIIHTEVVQTGCPVGEATSSPVAGLTLGCRNSPIPAKRDVLGCLRVGSAWACALWSGVSSLAFTPHSMSYFNEFAGGPTGGHRYLIGASIDWGQDQGLLKNWMKQHPEAQPLRVALYSFADPAVLGLDISSKGVPKMNRSPKSTAVTHLPAGDDHVFNELSEEQNEPATGWYAISVHRLHQEDQAYAYFRKYLVPRARIGYSIYVYHLDHSDVIHVRTQLLTEHAHSTSGLDLKPTK